MKEIQLIDVDFPNPNKTTVEEIERGISYLKDNSRFVRLIAIIITICLTLIWPWPMYVSSYVFSETFFTFWICLGIVWLLISFIIVGVYPIMQHYRTIKSILSLIYFDIKAFRDRD
ncbi:unnamed protein product [Adineta ricciae]|nr:unnamed protein product [Adineta ricciae]